MLSEFEKMGGTYRQAGDYLLPNLTLPEEEQNITLGRWGMEHKRYLKENRRFLYSKLNINGCLFRHCKEVEDRAKVVLDGLMSRIALAEGVTEQLKADDQMAWVGAMNNIKQRATEVVLQEVIYCV